MKKIVIPTDFSDNAWNATKYALELFKEEECTFFLVNTYTPAIANSRFMAAAINGVTIEDSVSLASKKGLQTVVKKIKKNYDNPRHKFNIISSFNLLVDEIKEIVEEENIDLIVTGTKGSSGLEEVFMGSNTVRIIKSIKNCPVLAIPELFDYSSPIEMAFATDFNRFYSLSELQPLITLAKTFKSVIRIVHVQYEIKALTELQHFNLGMLRKYFNEVEHYVHTVSELNSVSKTLEIFSSELDIHLLAMLNYQHSYMEKMTREPVVKRIAFHTQIPLLVIPELGMAPPSNAFKKEQKVLVK
ncbi:nucleotide-binding universal stress UspA family protein [Maribacter vaceletii]|uniref:Nucleotide-binding universal stress UspA family protein n=1 Tax=Maribacter vaceletii TaxID=1206816 RepID=A0A495EBG1_9FLAO|nr:universal stress protein [Maribacter vaceletii]RKR14222.1 nucleotide-binding universal stress UspA family protein [Maribacter vaceletii]